jgi:hypothetical protein
MICSRSPQPKLTNLCTLWLQEQLVVSFVSAAIVFAVELLRLGVCRVVLGVQPLGRCRARGAALTS